MNDENHNHDDDIISRYGCEQAVEDGVLVHPYPDRWPWLLISLNVHLACQPSEDDKRTYDQKLVPLLMDVIMASKVSENKAKLMEGGKVQLEGTIADTVVIGINDKGGLTVSQPCED